MTFADEFEPSESARATAAAYGRPQQWRTRCSSDYGGGCVRARTGVHSMRLRAVSTTHMRTNLCNIALER